MEPLQRGRFLCGANRNKNSINLKKGQRKGIQDFLKCALTFFFILSIKLKAFCVTQNGTSKVV